MSNIATLYEAARELACLRWTEYARDMSNERRLVRYVRSLRACERLKSKLLAEVAA